MATTADVLAGVTFFALLDDAERAILAERVDVIEEPAGKVLFHVGDPGDELYIVLRGEVEIFIKTKTGDHLSLEVERAGGFFGEISLLDPGPRTASAMAKEDVTLIVVDRGDLDELFRLKPGAALDLLTATGRRLRQNAEILRNTASRNVNIEEEDRRTLVGRVADWITDFTGTISFLMLHVAFFAVWILLNTKVFHLEPFDEYPFGLLTMIVSLEAIILSVFVLLSQNRQTARDRIRGDIEYQVNLKAELGIAHLHEKIDRLHSETLGRIAALDREVRIVLGHGQAPGARSTSPSK